jgi:predicted transcriptional regulator
MAQASIVRAWQDALYAYLAVRVATDIDGKDGEYIGRVPLADLQGLSAAQQKAALVAAVKAERERTKALLGGGGAQDIAGITGSVIV